MGLTSFLREATDCYERNPDAAWLGLEHAESLAQLEEQAGAANPRFGPKDENAARKFSRVCTAKEMRRRLLNHSPEGVLETKGIILERKSAKCKDSADKLDYRQLVEEQFNFFVERAVAVLRHGGVEITKKDLLRFSPEQIWSLEDDPDFKRAEQEYKLYEMRKPDFEALLVRRMIDSIEGMADQIEKTNPKSYRKAIPDHLQRLIYEAEWCNLYQLDAACAVLCGAILQEAIRFKLDAAEFGGVREAVKTAKNKALLPEQMMGEALELCKIRNDAAHGKRGLTQSLGVQRKELIPTTRKILDTLFPSGN